MNISEDSDKDFWKALTGLGQELHVVFYFVG